MDGPGGFKRNYDQITDWTDSRDILARARQCLWRRLAQGRLSQQHQRAAMAERLGPHPARAGAEREDRGQDGRARDYPGASLDGPDGPRLSGRLSERAAVPRHAPGQGDGGLSGDRLQPLARRACAAAGPAGQGDAVPAVQRSGRSGQDGRTLPRKARRRRFPDHLVASQAGARQRVYAALCHARGSRSGTGVSRPSELAGRVHLAAQPFHFHARNLVRAVQSGAPDQLGDQRTARTVSETAHIVDRERPGLACFRDAAARQRIPDALVGGAAAEETAERVHLGNVFHDAANGAHQHEAAGSDHGSGQGADPAGLCIGLAALGFRPAIDGLGPALPR